MTQPDIKKFFDEIGLSQGIENIKKFEEEIMLPEIKKTKQEEKRKYEEEIYYYKLESEQLKHTINELRKTITLLVRDKNNLQKQLKKKGVMLK